MNGPEEIGGCRLFAGDAKEFLERQPDGSVRCCVTSPPYWGLRDYGHPDQLGLEPTPEQYVANLVAVFRELRRVLADDGTLWLNLGDTYAGSGRGGYPGGKTGLQGAGKHQDQSRLAKGSQKAAGLHEARRPAGVVGRAWVPPPAGYKRKDLIGLPWMVAFALRADGWWLRSDIIWHKPNVTPESAADRPTRAHEYLFLLTKSQCYFYDAHAASEPASHAREAKFDNGKNGHGGGQSHAGQGSSTRKFGKDPTRRNARTVWTIHTRKSGVAHFATMPLKLAERCVRVGSAEGDTVCDPFSGAFTTAVAAVRHGRKFVGSELNPQYLADGATRVRAAVRAERESLFPAGAA